MLFGAYEHIEYKDPTDPLSGTTSAACDTIGGYTFPHANLNQVAFRNPKKLAVLWAGAQMLVTSKLMIWAAYYNIRQQRYATGANSGCITGITSVSSGCSGDLQALCAVAICGFDRHIDIHTGFMASNVTNGFVSGYVQTRGIDPTSGIRLRF